jgi:hypothetical protein
MYVCYKLQISFCGVCHVVVNIAQWNIKKPTGDSLLHPRYPDCGGGGGGGDSRFWELCCVPFQDILRNTHLYRFSKLLDYVNKQSTTLSCACYSEY